MQHVESTVSLTCVERELVGHEAFVKTTLFNFFFLHSLKEYFLLQYESLYFTAGLESIRFHVTTFTCLEHHMYWPYSV